LLSFIFEKPIPIKPTKKIPFAQQPKSHLKIKWEWLCS